MDVAAALPVEPAQRTRFARPQFGPPSIAAFAAFAALIVWNTTSATLLILPIFVIGCRYHELARYRSVHRSGLLLLLILWCVFFCVWRLESRLVREQGVFVPLAASVVLLGLGVHLFVLQRRLQREQVGNGLQLPSEDGPDWVCGGLLAGFAGSSIATLGFLIQEWRDPWAVAGGVFTGALLALQMRRHRWFWTLAIPCTLLGSIVDAIGLLWRADRWQGHTGELTWLVATTLLACLYLRLAPRVRRTFAATTA